MLHFIQKKQLEETLDFAEALRLVASNEAFLKSTIAHAFADLLVFAEASGLEITALPAWANLSTYSDQKEGVKIYTGDLKVEFEPLLDLCTAEHSKALELTTDQLKFQWIKKFPVPMTKGFLQIRFDLVSELPLAYKEALRAAGSLREIFEPEQRREVILCGTDS